MADIYNRIYAHCPVYAQVRETVEPLAVTVEEPHPGVRLEFDHHGELLGVEIDNVEIIIRGSRED